MSSLSMRTRRCRLLRAELAAESGPRTAIADRRTPNHNAVLILMAPLLFIAPTTHRGDFLIAAQRRVLRDMATGSYRRARGRRPESRALLECHFCGMYVP